MEVPIIITLNYVREHLLQQAAGVPMSRELCLDLSDMCEQAARAATQLELSLPRSSLQELFNPVLKAAAEPERAATIIPFKQHQFKQRKVSK
ncbi:hypothetical protein [Polycladidibacter hongkongensis]|uniref:hypothetical protein n=1 Tax=Polycladidibacter hongkongensis TaxID=1647556 RepID=UPI00082CC4F7|nr:hypothetical protein [Pseudovibrio hongkongensis]